MSSMVKTCSLLSVGASSVLVVEDGASMAASLGVELSTNFGTGLGASLLALIT